MKKTSIKERLFRLLAYLLILVLLIVTVYPFIWMILNSFKSNAEIFRTPLALPKTWDLSVFKKAWTNYNLGRAYANSLKITACVVLINLAVSSLAAYATSTLHFAGRKSFLLFCIGCQVVSGQVLLTPLFKLLVDTSLYSTHLGLILVMSAFSIPLSVYLFHGFFSELPRELYESATIDSCNSFQYLIHILLPLSKPIMSTVAIFQAMFAWNEFLFSMTFLKSEKLWSLQPMINNLFSGKTQNYGMQFAALSITVVPIVLLYFSLQKYFIKGMTAGAVKG